MVSGVRVFVYGTLRSGGALRAWLGDARCIALEVTVPGKMYRAPRGVFPVARFGSGHGYEITGDVFEVPIEAFNPMARMEEGAGFVVEAVHAGGQTCMAFAWPDVYDVGEPVQSGDWFEVAYPPERIRA